MSFRRIFPSIVGSVLTGFMAQSALACLELPHDPPPTEVYCLGEVNGVEQVKVVLPHYTTFAESDGYCACALNIPIQFGRVYSAQIVDAATQIPFAGFSFSPNANSGNGFPSNPPNSPEWQGFSSQVHQAITGGLDVDIVFYVTSHGDIQVKCDNVVNYLNNAEELAVTDAADEDGIPIGKHQGILKNPGIRVIKKDVSARALIGSVGTHLCFTASEMYDTNGDGFGDTGWVVTSLTQSDCANESTQARNTFLNNNTSVNPSMLIVSLPCQNRRCHLSLNPKDSIPSATFSSSVEGSLHIPVVSTELNLPGVPSYVEFYEVDMTLNPNTACGSPSFLVTQAKKLK